MEEKWNCFPTGGMLSRGLLLACVDHVKCRVKFLHQLGILWNLPPFDRVSRWKGATVSVQCHFHLLYVGLSLGQGVCCFAFSGMKTDVISPGYWKLFLILQFCCRCTSFERRRIPLEVL